MKMKKSHFMPLIYICSIEFKLVLNLFYSSIYCNGQMQSYKLKVNFNQI